MTPKRRDILAAAAAAPFIAAARPAAAQSPGDDAARIEAWLRRYVSFGVKASGGPGDIACSEWLESELKAAGLATRRLTYDIPFADIDEASLTVGNARAELIPQAVVVTTGAGPLEAPLAIFDPTWMDAGVCKGAIALILLPFARWSTIVSPAVHTAVDRAVAAGAKGVVLVTTGPTGEAIALNAPAAAPEWPVPVACAAPKDMGPFLKANGQGARLTIRGRTGRRPAYSLMGTLDRGRAKNLIVSTPKSGWFTCAAERGPGVAAWLYMARWAAKNATNVNLVMVANSGHEYENSGSDIFIEHEAPKPADTVMWAHIGANVAARDWRDTTPPVPLDNVDPQRTLMVTDDLIPAARKAFAGQPGLELPRPTSAGPAGELIGILKAGYPSAFGMFGTHRFHHAKADDERCIIVPPTVAAAHAIRDLIASKVAGA